MTSGDPWRLREGGTTVRREIAAGLATFMTLSYILSVQPAVLARAGMDPGAVLVATCLGSALACFLMGWLARYPVALAPAMGHNFYFVFTVVGAMGFTWQAGLAANLVAGLLFVVAAALNLQGRLVAAIPPSLRHGMAVGIGLFVALIGLQWSGIVDANPGTMVGLGDLGSRPVLVALAVLAATACLMALRVPGAILWGMLLGVALAVPLGVTRFHGVFSAPPSLAPTLFAFDLGALLRSAELWTVVLVLWILDVFDTMGTLVGVASQAGLMRGGELPRAREAFLSDAIGTVGGACLGTSTITSYVESAAGIAVGGRTGLTAIVVGVLFLLSIFLFPLVRTIGEGFALEGGRTLYPITAPALILVGSMMMRSAREIEWDDPVAALPAFLTMVLIPLTFSISEGLAFGFVACSLLMVVSRRSGRRDWPLHAVAGVFLLRWIAL